MEQTEKYRHKLADLKKAVDSLGEALKVNLFSFTEEISDLIRNGQIQKFEYCSELLWKTVKTALEEQNGFVATAPKNVYRGLFQNGYIDELECEKLILMVDDRNLLSHLYSENYYEKIHQRLPEHLKLMKSIIAKIA